MLQEKLLLSQLPQLVIFSNCSLYVYIYVYIIVIFQPSESML